MPFADVSVSPEKGAAIIWFHSFINEDPDPMSIHASCPVLLGHKWIGNKWIGYNPQWNTTACGLGEANLFKIP